MAETSAGTAALVAADERLLGLLRAGDEDAFRALVRLHTSSMTRVALAFVSRRAVAEEVVQETWLNVLRGLERFEGRSSLRTWIFVILGNCARRRAEQEGRALPMSLASEEAAGDDTGVPPGRFFESAHPRWGGMWSTCVPDWDRLPEDRLLASELRVLITGAIDDLPPVQRAVITLRDVEGWPADEVCELLEISDANQRVLLHRARGAVRRSIEHYIGEE